MENFENLMFQEDLPEINFDKIYIKGKKIDKLVYELIVKASKKGIDLYPYLDRYAQDSVKLTQIYLGLLSKVNVSLYDKEYYSPETMCTFREAMERKLDVSKLSEDNYNNAQITAYVNLMDYGVDINPILDKTLKENEIRFLGKCLLEKKDISIYFKEDGTHYCYEKMKQLKKIQNDKITLEDLDIEHLNPQQLREIRMGFYAGIDYKKYSKANYSYSLMQEIRNILELGLEIPDDLELSDSFNEDDFKSSLKKIKDKELKSFDYIERDMTLYVGENYKDKYDENQIKQLKRAIIQGYNIDILTKENYSAEQMEEIIFGFEDKIDVSNYTDITLTDLQMHKIRTSLVKEKENKEFINDFIKKYFKNTKKKKYPINNLHLSKNIEEKKLGIEKENKFINCYIYFKNNLIKIFSSNISDLEEFSENIKNFINELSLEDDDLEEHIELLKFLLKE